MLHINKRKRLVLLYRIYFIASFIPLAIFLQLTAYFYLSAFRDYVTISHLFLLAFLLGFTMHLRNNAFHYQLLLVHFEDKESKIVCEKKLGTSVGFREVEEKGEKSKQRRKRTSYDRHS